MAKGLGSTGGATMQRSKLSLKQESKSFDAKTDDGSGGGVGGKGIFNGGGGDNDDGDGDDYFDEFGDGDEGDGDSSFFRTVVLAENYSRCAPQAPPVSFRTVLPEASVPHVAPLHMGLRVLTGFHGCCRVAIEAVLSEWMRTVSSLPLILRQAVEMGLFSSAQLVRFCAMDNRPNVTRAVSRLLPATVRPMSQCTSCSCFRASCISAICAHDTRPPGGNPAPCLRPCLPGCPWQVLAGSCS